MVRHAQYLLTGRVMKIWRPNLILYVYLRFLLLTTHCILRGEGRTQLNKCQTCLCRGIYMMFCTAGTPAPRRGDGREDGLEWSPRENCPRGTVCREWFEFSWGEQGEEC